MATMTVVRGITAPPNVVFQTIADPRRFAQAISGVTSVEFLSEIKSGIGTRFRQTRTMNGKVGSLEFEITEYVENERIRLVNETRGTLWDATFTVAPYDGTTILTMRMEATTKRFLPNLVLALVCLLIRKAVEKDIDGVKALCERGASP